MLLFISRFFILARGPVAEPPEAGKLFKYATLYFESFVGFLLTQAKDSESLTSGFREPKLKRLLPLKNKILTWERV